MRHCGFSRGGACGRLGRLGRKGDGLGSRRRNQRQQDVRKARPRGSGHFTPPRRTTVERRETEADTGNPAPAHGACGCSCVHRRGTVTAGMDAGGGDWKASTMVSKSRGGVAAKNARRRCSGAPGAWRCFPGSAGVAGGWPDARWWTQPSSALWRRNGTPCASKGWTSGAIARAQTARRRATGAASHRRCACLDCPGSMGLTAELRPSDSTGIKPNRCRSAAQGRLGSSIPRAVCLSSVPAGGVRAPAA